LENETGAVAIGDRPRNSSITSDGSPSGDDADENHHDSDDEQQVDQSTADVNDKEAKQPQDDQNYGERPEHVQFLEVPVRC
jgi:hypothetical protein